MKYGIYLALIALLLMPMLLSAQKTAEADRILGVWFNGEKSSKIEVFKTTTGSYAGRIIWLKEPNDEAGKPKVDHKNSTEALKSRPLINLNVLTGLSYKGKAKYDGGTIYDPKSGNTYSCKAEFEDDNTLKLRGFMGVSLLGRTDIWTRTTK